MTASEARWQQYLNKKPDSKKDYEFIISQIRLFVKTKARDLIVKISDTMIIAKLKHDGYKVEPVVIEGDPEESVSKYRISW